MEFIKLLFGFTERSTALMSKTDAKSLGNEKLHEDRKNFIRFATPFVHSHKKIKNVVLPRMDRIFTFLSISCSAVGSFQNCGNQAKDLRSFFVASADI